MRWREGGREGGALSWLTAHRAMPWHRATRMCLNNVTSDKKGFSRPNPLYVDRSHRSLDRTWVFHESTVGVGLPIPSTLKDIAKSGDKVLGYDILRHQ